MQESSIGSTFPLAISRLRVEQIDQWLQQDFAPVITLASSENNLINRDLERPLPSLYHEDLVGLFHISQEPTLHRLDIFQEPKYHLETTNQITFRC